MSEYQKTLAREVELSGVGLHTGNKVHMKLKPGRENQWFVFVRTDLEGLPSIEASVQFVSDTERGTVLEKNGVKIHTIEHVLAALTGMDIDNAIIELDDLEVPILDGSSKFFVEAIQNAGIVDQKAKRDYYEVSEIVSYIDKATGSEIIAMPSNEYQITTMVDFGTKVLGTQNATMNHVSEFKDKIANARTFSFLHELEQLLEAGLIKGGDLNNAIIYVDKEISDLTRKKLEKAFEKNKISIKPNGILDNLTLYYPNEAARHKLLDVIGDLALIGTKIKGKIIATKPGHFVNTQFARKLHKHIKIAKRKTVPKYDPLLPPIMDIEDIMSKLRHRFPFLLVDKIIEMTDNYIVGIKNVTFNEPFFAGHFPGTPIMPGVLQVEAMAQAGGLFVLSKVSEPENHSTYLMKINNVKFKRKVIPGDTLIFKLELLSPFRRGICHMQGYGYVRNNLVVEAEIMAQITKKK